MNEVVQMVMEWDRDFDRR